ncbi:MAG: HlyD family efflux transporter periplasmic adaptor subunit [Acidobacteria bacterium]|nr:HlyD family efflux transporter periplasmic adaptor subunit [Acidobacteriota bacterium]
MSAPGGRRWAIAGVIVLAAAAVAGGWGLYGRYRAVSSVPSAVVSRGAFLDEVSVRGDVRPLRALNINAPMSSSGELRIVRLARNGTAVRKGDLIVQFDPAALRRTLDEKRSELRQAEAEIDRLRGEARIREEQDATDLAKARYDVERARLDTSTEELISRVEAEKFKLTLADAEQKHRETQARLEANRRAAAADEDSRRQRRDKAALEVAKAERDLAALTLAAPGDGTVNVLTNRRAGGPFGNGREFREGDRAWAGAAIAEVPDLTAVEIVANIDEADRGRVREEQEAVIRVDALPDKELRARVSTISAIAKVVFEGWPPVKQFEMRLRLITTDPRLKSGMSATATIAAERTEGQLLLPVAAAFQKGGRQVAYARRGLGWEERPIVVARRNARWLVVTSGIAEGDRVALRDPAVAAEEVGAR